MRKRIFQLTTCFQILLSFAKFLTSPFYQKLILRRFFIPEANPRQKRHIKKHPTNLTWISLNFHTQFLEGKITSVSNNHATFSRRRHRAKVTGQIHTTAIYPEQTLPGNRWLGGWQTSQPVSAQWWRTGIFMHPPGIDAQSSCP